MAKTENKISVKTYLMLMSPATWDKRQERRTIVMGWPGKKGWRMRWRSQRLVTRRALEPRFGRLRGLAHQGRLCSRQLGFLCLESRRRGDDGGSSLSESDGQSEDWATG
jgi:hypothetical protein